MYIILKKKILAWGWSEREMIQLPQVTEFLYQKQTSSFSTNNPIHQ